MMMNPDWLVLPTYQFSFYGFSIFIALNTLVALHMNNQFNWKERSNTLKAD